jgi:hypothetical protein
VTNSGHTWCVIVELLGFKMGMKYVELESKKQLLFYDIIIIHFSISKPSTIYCVLGELSCGPVYSHTASGNAKY